MSFPLGQKTKSVHAEAWALFRFYGECECKFFPVPIQKTMKSIPKRVTETVFYDAYLQFSYGFSCE